MAVSAESTLLFKRGVVQNSTLGYLSHSSGKEGDLEFIKGCDLTHGEALLYPMSQGVGWGLIGGAALWMEPLLLGVLWRGTGHAN